MYATSPFQSPARHMSAMYRQVGAVSAVDSASPHRLVAMLYDGLLEAIAEGRGAIDKGDIEHKCRALSRAVRIVEEGLHANLNLEKGGELAANLSRLYAYVAQRLTLANLRNDPAMLAECCELVKPLREAWLLIDPQAETAAS